MTNIINIKEEENRLCLESGQDCIVCGNSNYILKFDFGEAWLNASRKAAIFVVGANKLTVDFEGDECAVPALPNASFVQVSLVSAVGETELVTTAATIRLEPTIVSSDYSEFNQLTNYLTKVLGAINKIEAGEVTAKNAVNAQSAASATIATTATNATSAVTAQTAEVAKNVANANLLLNGAFFVNQRAQSSYSENLKYTVDRWMLSGGSVTVNSNKTISHTSTAAGQGILQYIENPSIYAGEKLTLCARGSSSVNVLIAEIRVVKQNASEATILQSATKAAIGEGEVVLTAQIPTDITDNDKLCVVLLSSGISTTTWKFAKLETGENATKFYARPYAEELVCCKRYFNVFNSERSAYKRLSLGYAAGFNATSTTIRFFIDYPTMRIAPTVLVLGTFSIYSPSTNLTYAASGTMPSTENIMIQFVSETAVTTNVPLILYSAVAGTAIELDAEIY